MKTIMLGNDVLAVAATSETSVCVCKPAVVPSTAGNAGATCWARTVLNAATTNRDGGIRMAIPLRPHVVGGRKLGSQAARR